MAENLALISDRLVELKELQGDDEVVLPLLKDISSVLFDIISNGVGGPTEIGEF